MSIEPTANNFCSLPFVGLFYKNNSASSCCVMNTKPFSPKEYLEHKETIELRQTITENKKSDKCNNCWTKEQKGLVSIRNYFMKKPEDLTKIRHLELRESNLCNFSCRMCHPTDSSSLEKEVKTNSELQEYFSPNIDKPSTENNWNQILELCKDVELIHMTGGEPMLMKRYYSFLDHLISIGKQNVSLSIFTNGSVYNPIFVEKMINFSNVRLNFSIDAVGKVAEYQRYGTDWKIITENVQKYLKLPIKIKIHSTMTAYSILGVSDLADYFIELVNTKCAATLTPFSVHTVSIPQALEFSNLNLDLRVRAVKELDSAIIKLSVDERFNDYIRELKSVRAQLLSRKDCDFDGFVKMTKALDKVRNQSFEDTFGYKI